MQRETDHPRERFPAPWRSGQQRDAISRRRATDIEMNCPKCNVTLTIADRQGVEIDFCPQCRGVWLDRGELDKIIDRFATSTSTPPGTSEAVRRRDDDDDRRDRRYRDDDDYKYGKRKKRGFLGDIFDF